MKRQLIRLSKSCLTSQEKNLVKKVLDKEFLGMGPEVNNFEKELKRFFQRDVVCFNSGTAALQVALQSIGIKSKDEVLVPSITYIASFQAISATGAIPVMCDIDINTLQICLKSIKKNITKKTKVIMPVHYSGSVGQFTELLSLAKKRNLRIIEDAAHAFGTKFKNRRIGSFGDITCFSFDGIKNITSGEGGCLVTNDKKVINLSKDIRLLGVSNESNKRYLGHRSWINDVKTQGWRYHMSDINAAIGRVQLKKFSFFSKRRRELCKFYDKQFLSNLRIQTFKRNFNEEVPHIYVVRILNLKKRELLRKKMQSFGIQTGIHYIPGYKFTKYKKNKFFFANTEKVYKEILTLPLHPDLNKKNIKFICQKLSLILKTNPKI